MTTIWMNNGLKHHVDDDIEDIVGRIIAKQAVSSSTMMRLVRANTEKGFVTLWINASLVSSVEP